MKIAHDSSSFFILSGENLKQLFIFNPFGYQVFPCDTEKVSNGSVMDHMMFKWNLTLLISL